MGNPNMGLFSEVVMPTPRYALDNVNFVGGLSPLEERGRQTHRIARAYLKRRVCPFGSTENKFEAMNTCNPV